MILRDFYWSFHEKSLDSGTVASSQLSLVNFWEFPMIEMSQ